MAIKMQVLINGVDYAKYTDLESISVDNNVVMTSDTASCKIQLDGELIRPRAGQEFIWNIVNTSTGAELSREFGGVVVSVLEETEGPSLIYSLTIKSYEHWFDRHLVTAWYNQDFGDVTIKQMVNTFCPGFTTNNVQATPSPIIPQYFNYQKPSECLRIIADQVQYGWYVDYWKDVHHYPKEFFKSPLPNNLYYTDTDFASASDLSLMEDGEQVYNKVYISGFKTRSKD